MIACFRDGGVRKVAPGKLSVGGFYSCAANKGLQKELVLQKRVSKGINSHVIHIDSTTEMHTVLQVCIDAGVCFGIKSVRFVQHAPGRFRTTETSPVEMFQRYIAACIPTAFGLAPTSYLIVTTDVALRLCPHSFLHLCFLDCVISHHLRRYVPFFSACVS